MCLLTDHPKNEMKTSQLKGKTEKRFRHKLIGILAVFLFLSVHVKGSLSETDSVATRNEYIEPHQEQLALKLALTNNIETFSVHSSSSNYRLLPNTENKLKLFFSYRFILFSVAYSPNFLPDNNDISEKGESDIFEFATNVNLKRWLQRLSYSKITGFYADGAYKESNNNQYLTFPQLEYKGFSGYTAYKVNPNFSVLALETQTERQLKSAGSLMPILVYRYYTVDNKIKLGENDSSQKSSNLELNLSLGYFYTFVINKKWYASAGVAVGGGIIHTKLLTRFYDTTIKSNSKLPIFRTEGEVALGYNSKRFFAGLQMATFFERYNQSKASNAITHDDLNFQLFFGYRFNAPGFLSRSIDTVLP